MRGEYADAAALADIVQNDVAVCARLIEAANSSFYGRPHRCETVERAIHSLGTGAVKTVVITAAIQQYYSAFADEDRAFLAGFWRRSLLIANLARTFADLTRYPSSEEAYLGGLLSGIGRLLLLLRGGEKYVALHDGVESTRALLAGERAMFDRDHAALGAEVLTQWGMDDALVRAVRDQYQDIDPLLQAEPLVKLLAASARLAEGDSIRSDALDATHRLFGLGDALIETIYRRMQSDVAGLAAVLGISIGLQEDGELRARYQQDTDQIGERLTDVGEVAPISAALWQARREGGLRDAIRRGLQLTLGIDHSVLFLLDDGSHIVADIPEIDGLLVLPMVVGDSVTANALIEQAPRIADDPAVLAPVEQQLLEWSGVNSLCAWPLLADGVPLGVLVIMGEPWASQKVLDKPGPLRVLCDEIARFVAANRQVVPSADDATLAAPDIQAQLAAAVSRSANPAAIVSRYLDELRANLAAVSGAEHAILSEEIERVGQVLLRLRSLEDDAQASALVDVNAAISALVGIFKGSMFLTRGIEVHLQLDPDVPAIDVSAVALRQVLANLLSNAAEAMPDGGDITVCTEGAVYLAGVEYVDITVRDTGPGISAAIKRNLFRPMASPKGGEHAGLGLSVVKQLVDDMRGSIICRTHAGSTASGTEFQVLLPVSGAATPQS